jgi:hypothetical protein
LRSYAVDGGVCLEDEVQYGHAQAQGDQVIVVVVLLEELRGGMGGGGGGGINRSARRCV